jgi:signal transduction histidine kinase
MSTWLEPCLLAAPVAGAALARAWVDRRAARDARLNREVVAVMREMRSGADGRQAVCEAAQRITGCSRAILFEPGGNTGGLPTAPTASAGSVGSRAAGDADRLLYQDAVRVWLDGQPRFVPDAFGGALLFEPVLRNGIAVAVLCLRFRGRTGTLARHKRTAVTLLAADAAVAIERAEHAARERASDRSEAATRLARDLHDSVSQDVALSALYAHTAITALDRGDPDDARQLLVETTGQLTRAQEDLRSVMHSLRHGHRVDGATTLPELVDALAAEHERRAEAPVAVARDVCDWTRVAPEVADALYFAVREALHNALKHAKGAGVRVELRADDQQVGAVVRDEGPGFDLAAVPEGRWGLIGMRERAEQLGGSTRVLSCPGEGTTVTVSLPRSGAAMPATP